MENFGVTGSGNELRVEGVPDAVMIVAVEGPLAKRLADLALHRADLEFAVAAIARMDSSTDEIVREALWRIAIVFYVKCFTGGSARSQLNEDTIYRDKQDALAAYQYFKNLRNKHFIHDESSYMQCLTGAALNDGTKPHKVEKVLCMSVAARTLDDASLQNLQNLVSVALEWVTGEVEHFMNRITKALEAESYDALAARKAMTYTAPTLSDLGSRRASAQ